VLCVCVYTFGRSLLVLSLLQSRVILRLSEEWCLSIDMASYTNRVQSSSGVKMYSYSGVVIGLHRKESCLRQCCARSVLMLSFHLGRSDLCLPNIYHFSPFPRVLLPHRLCSCFIQLKLRISLFCIVLH